MTFQVPLSQLGNRRAEYEMAVQAHIAAMHGFAHEVGTPRPTSHPAVEAAIRRIQVEGKPDEYVADYEIVDDTPPPPSLEQRKEPLYRAIQGAEEAAKEKILPKRKIRLAICKMQAASLKLEEDRTAEEREDIASYLLVQATFRKIELEAAQAESDLDDLTEQTLDSFHPPIFG